MVMEIISHTSLYLEKQIVSLAVGVIISFLDILIAMKRKNKKALESGGWCGDSHMT